MSNKNTNQVLNVLSNKLVLAYQRNAFNLEEAHKIFECIRMFYPIKPTNRLVDAPITTQNDALIVMSKFLELAHSKNIFDIAESAQIHDCLNYFKKTP